MTLSLLFFRKSQAKQLFKNQGPINQPQSGYGLRLNGELCRNFIFLVLQSLILENGLLLH